MKAEYKTLIIFFLIVLTFPLSAENNKKSTDPIGNSYIINNLEMETANDPFKDTVEVSDGEIIFDNTFDDTLLTKPRRKKNNGNINVLQKLQKKDKRWHLVEYKVKKNDSVWKIARRYGTEISVVLSLNNLSPNGLIRENDTLLIPSRSGVRYRIKRGDTLSEIADKFDTDVEKIADHNNIDGNTIIAGKSIFIPGAVESKKSVPAGRADKKVSEKKYYASGRTKYETTEKSSKKLRLSWPLRGPITSGFGYRKHPFSGQKSFHCGLDIGAEIGTPVKAAGSGIVIFSGWKGAYGNLLVLQHSNNYITVYAHNSKHLVKSGEKVKKGQKIALSGKTGAVTGAHLHFEIRKGIVPLNPTRILK